MTAMDAVEDTEGTRRAFENLAMKRFVRSIYLSHEAPPSEIRSTA